MLELTLADLLEGLTGWRPSIPLASAELDQPLANVHMDSREVVKGGLFFALRGEQLDGHTFLPDALARGCRAIVAERAPASGCTVLDTRDAEALAELFCQLPSSPALQDTPLCLLVPDSLGA
ncbi:MAG: hypothetical protein JSV36_10780, partial [Anaerolineae bacterium]